MPWPRSSRPSRSARTTIPDLVLVNLKGPDYVGHAYGPASPEIKEELAELDRQVTRALQILERKAGAGRFVVAIAADHGMPGEPRARRPALRRRHRQAHRRPLLAGGGTVVQYFNDAANNEIHLDTAKLRSLNVSLRDVAAFLEAGGGSPRPSPRTRCGPRSAPAVDVPRARRAAASATVTASGDAACPGGTFHS